MDVAEFLGLVRLDESTWSFEVVDRLITPARFLYGGCGLAAGLVALEQASARPTIYGVAQYVAFAQPGETATVSVDLAAVGQRVTQGRATIHVNEREVLTIVAALGAGTLQAGAWVAMPAVAPPEACPPRRFHSPMSGSVFEHLDVRVARGRTFDQLDGSPGSADSALWVRVPHHLDPSAGTLAIVGDLVSGGASQPMGRPVMGRSLDNTVRVANRATSEWILCDVRMHALVDGIGQGMAFLWTRDGVLLGTASQSMVARVIEPEPPRGGLV
ncbi:MAG TPA: acyl-CoA thioesterase [Acidimicrobiales bacterium]|nr:acyl-CoA thioesterase [Acidimicrobiales bacterium]